MYRVVIKEVRLYVVLFYRLTNIKHGQIKPALSAGALMPHYTRQCGDVQGYINIAK